MEAWVAALIAVLVPASGGGLWATLRWWLQSKERREQAQQTHEAALLTRFETMQAAFLDALKEIREEASEQIERHRGEHLADVKLSAERMSEAIRAVQQMQTGTRGASSRPGSL